MENSTESTYQYKGIPLSPYIAEVLILKLLTGKTTIRQSIVDEIVNYHESQGGLKGVAQDIPRVVKRSLKKLKERGIADNPSYGYWRIGETSIEDSQNEVENTNFELEEVVDVAIADKVIGLGKSCIYLYYLPMYRLRAETEKESIWHCKIGRTDRDPLLRVLSQAATALPEKPHIALILRTDYPSEFEGAIHKILTIRGRKIDSSPGSEWFLTSPHEVEKIIEYITTGKSVDK
jgi:hypothetical protein